MNNQIKSKPKTALSPKIFTPTVKPCTLMLSCFAYNKIRYLANKANTEIGFWCIGCADDPLYVKDVVVLRQTANVVYNKFDDDAFADFVQDMAQKGYDLDEFAFIWGHTHPKGCSAQPSATDEDTFSDKDKFGNKQKLVMFILSQSGDMYARLRETTQFCTVETELQIEVDTESFQDVIDKCIENPNLVSEWDESLKLVKLVENPTSFAWTSKVQKVSKTYKNTTQNTVNNSEYFGKVPGEEVPAEDEWLNGWDSDYGFTSNAYYNHSTDEAGGVTLNNEWLDSLFVCGVVYDERGEIDTVEEYSDQDLMIDYGCDSSTLSTVYRTFCYDLLPKQAVALIKYCAAVEKAPFSEWSLANNVTDALKMVSFKVRKKETTSEAVDRLFTKETTAIHVLEELERRAIYV